MTMRIANRDARRVWLHLQGMAAPPPGRITRAQLAASIQRLGLVQLDPLCVVARAHDHILWSRNTAYRPPMLEKLLARDRAVFEHFSHDACLLPMAIYPLWHRQRDRITAKMRRSTWGADLPDAAERHLIRERIAAEGPLCSRDFEGTGARAGEVWKRSPHRVALDYMWHEGTLATAERRNFTKVFDLAERVIPDALRGDVRSDAEQLDWLCRSALDRLGFGTVREIKAFYDAADLAEIATTLEAGRYARTIEVEGADGIWHTMLAREDIEAVLTEAPQPAGRLRIVNPFDPIVRDRGRALRLFGFDYRIEIYTPAAQRRYGYYVYPLLEGDRFVGRAEIRHDRKSNALVVDNLWPERGVRPSTAREQRLDAELARLARAVGAEAVQRHARF